MIAIVDYDTGNLCSVWNALERLGVQYVITDNADIIKKADKVLLPGVGEAATAMAKLRERGLCEVIKGLTQPVLGICIGMQLMCRCSEEGNTECLGIFDTEVKRFSADKSAGVKVPHMGWNEIRNLKTPLLDNLKEGEFLYFIHSFAPRMCNEAIATSENGVQFAAALNKGNFYGTQFHPEKSGIVGELILKNFIEKC